MSTVKLTPTQKPELMLECPTITPDAFAGKSAARIADLDVMEGKIRRRLGEYFSVEGAGGKTAGDTQIVIQGDCSRIKYIGYKMSAGSITVRGNADMYVGGWMTGGTILVDGNVDSFCGIGMEGGEIQVKGRAQNYVGSAYRGDWRGMKGGTIRIAGDAGNDIGTYLNGGTIVIGGNAFIHVANHAEGGTVIIKGDAVGRVGGQMVKGDIYVLGSIEHMLPGFRKVESVRKDVDGVTATFDHYVGDLGERHPKSRGKEIYGNLYLRAEPKRGTMA